MLAAQAISSMSAPPTPARPHEQRSSQHAQAGTSLQEFTLGGRRGLKYKTQNGNFRLVSKAEEPLRGRLIAEALRQGWQFLNTP